MRVQALRLASEPGLQWETQVLSALLVARDHAYAGPSGCLQAGPPNNTLFALRDRWRLVHKW